MKKIALLALLFAAAAAVSAQAQDDDDFPVHIPQAYVNYTCTYNNPTMQEQSPGWSIFKIAPVFQDYSLIRGIEDYAATHQFGWDNRKVSFWEPVNGPPNPHGVIGRTLWRFKVNPSGPECRVLVSNYGRNMSFTSCSDGHSRTCTR